MRIHQLNIQYLADQDRVLARISTAEGQEFRLWFTRRLTVGLLPALRKMVGEQMERDALKEAGAGKDPAVRRALSEFQKDQLMRQSDFKTPFKEPTAPVEDPLLVTEVQMNSLSDGNLQLKFKSPAPEAGKTRELAIALNGQLMNGFMHLLEKAYTQSQWTQVLVEALEVETTVAASPDAERPKYLN